MPVLKTGVAQATVGSNPTLSAKMNGHAVRCAFSFWYWQDSNASDPRVREKHASGTFLARRRDSDHRERSDPTLSAKMNGHAVRCAFSFWYRQDSNASDPRVREKRANGTFLARRRDSDHRERSESHSLHQTQNDFCLRIQEALFHAF